MTTAVTANLPAVSRAGVEQFARRVAGRHPRVKSAAKLGLDLAWQARVAFLGATSAPVVVTDEYGVRVVVYPAERPAARYNLRREDDREAFRVMAHVLRPGDVALDVGANIGVYSVHAGRLVGPTGRVFAFEPVPSTLERLRETIAVNRSANITVVPAAVTDRAGPVVVNVFAGEDRSGWSSLGRHPMVAPGGEVVEPSIRVEVPGETLDGFCERNGLEHVRFCKVDVEGFEKSVFDGAARMLTEQRVDVVAFEISDGPLEGEHGTPLGVFSSLVSRGYTLFRSGSSGPVDPVAEDERLLHGGDGSYMQNYFACSDARQVL